MKESKVFIVDELVKNFKEYECFYIVNIFSIPVNDLFVKNVLKKMLFSRL